ncbi:50S ribosomal protein l27-like [Plakobranchus ocellatus]|uniref:50S ribosomal protein l27-like n=1 Tax=Plakobranchus ocellatus TaxID=259542 RepID=A0AAV3ZF39_9GAST|nr:50S ribosomal protein l27-like [Plakobranchus ocellatus]
MCSTGVSLGARLVSSLRHVYLLSHSLRLSLPAFSAVPARAASKKSGGAPKNKIGRTKPKFRGLKAFDGSFVHKGDVLATQYDLKYYPGENVSIDNFNTLRAAYDGIVVYSTEVLDPYPDSPLFEHVQNGSVLQRRFLNVIPTPLHGKFRLVSET